MESEKTGVSVAEQTTFQRDCAVMKRQEADQMQKGHLRNVVRGAQIRTSNSTSAENRIN